MQVVRLDHDTDLAGFRREARNLLAQGVPPQQVHWSAGARHDDLFAAAGDAEADLPAQGAPRVPVPAAFVELCGTVILHRDPRRFALLYRLLWRLVHEPALRHDPLDGDVLKAQEMAKSVRRDIHKMHAFVRFRRVQDRDDPADPLHVAWFEPEHHIVEANADWFRRRFANMRWAILTPDRCVAWDRERLSFGPGASREQAPAADDGEQLWLTYYRSIFNPARLKLAMMKKEMPRKYWRNLPEAESIGELAARALERSAAMIAQEPGAPHHRVVTFRRAPVPEPAAGSLEALRDATSRCRRCPLGARATQAVPGEGPREPALMFVGEQPGDQEDLQGRAFVGPAGQLLDRAFAQAGIDRAQCYVTNAVKHFSHELRGKRRIHKTPSQQEAAACAQWLEEEIALVRPHAVVALGATAARSLLGRPVAVMRERGAWQRRADGLRVFVTVHPSMLLRLPSEMQAEAFTHFVEDLRLATTSDTAAALLHHEQPVT